MRLLSLSDKERIDCYKGASVANSTELTPVPTTALNAGNSSNDIDAMNASHLSTSSFVSPAVDKIKGASHDAAGTFINQQRVKDLHQNQIRRAVPESFKPVVICAHTSSQDKGEPVPDTSSPLPRTVASDNPGFAILSKADYAHNAVNIFPEFDALPCAISTPNTNQSDATFASSLRTIAMDNPSLVTLEKADSAYNAYAFIAMCAPAQDKREPV